MTSDDLNDLVRQARDDFDASFAQPAALPQPVGLRLLCVRAGGHALALRLDEISSLVRCPPITLLPGALIGEAGLAAVRGRLIVVHRAERVLGESATLAAEGGGWLAIASGDATAGVVFDELEGYLEVGHEALLAPADTPDGPTAAAMVALPKGSRPILALARWVTTMATTALLAEETR